jgi:two-component system, NtrC family, sensor kinase
MKETRQTTKTDKAPGESSLMLPEGNADSFLRSIAQNSADAMYFIDAGTEKFLYTNPAFEQLTGYSGEEANGFGGYSGFVEKIGHKSPDEDHEAVTLEAIVSGSSGTVERWIRRKDGHVVCLSERSTFLYDGPRLTSVCGIMRDITQRKEQEIGLFRSFVLLRTVVDHLPDMVYAKDRDGRKIHSNPADLQQLGCRSMEEVLDKDDFAFYTKETAQRFWDDDQQVLTTGQSVIGKEESFRDRDGNVRWLLTTKIPIRNARGEITGLVGVGHDITKRKKSEESLKFFRSLIDRSSDCIEVFDPISLRFIDANETTLKSLGYTREELMQIPVPVVDPEAERDIQRVAKAIKETGAVLIRRRQRRKDGTSFPAEVHLSLVELDKAYVVAVVRDISAREEVETSLKESEERFRLISENVVDLMAVLDESGICLYASLSHTHDRFRPDTLVGKDYLAHIHPNDIAAVKEKMAMVANGLGYQTIQFRFRGGDGVWRFKDTSITLLVDDRGSRLLMVSRDISERISQDEKRRALEMEISERNAVLERTLADVRNMQQGLIQSEKMASIGQLTAGIAHEINNPLAFVSSNLNRFKEYFDCLLEIVQGWDAAKPELKSEPRFAALVAKIEETEDAADLAFVVEDFETLMKHTADGTERIRSIVDRLRGFSHMATSALEKADVNAALDDTINLTWNELKYKATIEKEYGDVPHVTCNIGEIKQVLVNLLVNAAHALPDKGTITLRTLQSDDYVIIQVKDTGAGIPEANLKRIFDPFFTTKAVGKGTGLGLWISTTIIQKHHGTLTVESEPGKGTTMSIRLPIDQPSEAGT